MSVDLPLTLLLTPFKIETHTTMDHPAQIQPWKMNSAVTDFMIRNAEAGTQIQPSKGRANFYPEGAMMFNGGQGAGDGGDKVIYDTGGALKTVCVILSWLSV